MRNNPQAKIKPVHKNEQEKARKEILKQQSQRIRQAIEHTNDKRQALGFKPLSQNKIATAAGISASTLTYITQGKTRISQQSAFLIGRILDKNPAFLRYGIGSIADTFQKNESAEPVTDAERYLVHAVLKQSDAKKAALSAFFECKAAPPICLESEREIFNLLLNIVAKRHQSNDNTK